MWHCASHEIARAFVLNGAHVIMVNRKEDQGQQAIENIKKEAGQDAKIEWKGCNMGNLRQINEVFTEIREQEDRLDLVSSRTHQTNISNNPDIAYSLRWH
jgi:NAD(P)-dependent dehydrogenase (short-subunit alcohol dehydrogenase family)